MADPFTDPTNRAAYMGQLLATKLVSTTVAPTGAPAQPPDARNLFLTSVATINGNRTIEAQQASISYMDDNSKLILPLGITQADNTPDDQRRVFLQASRVASSVRHIAGATGIAADKRYAFIVTRPAGDSVPWAGSVDTWHTHTSNHSIALTWHTGYFAADGTRQPRNSIDDACDVYLTVKYDDADNACAIFAFPIDAGQAVPNRDHTLLARREMDEQLAAYVSSQLGMNYSILDYGFIHRDECTWLDVDCQTVKTIDRFTPKLTSYTTAMTAALNLAAVKQIGYLAWARAYITSMGMLPATNSLHNREWLTSEYLPENAHLQAVLNVHPTGAETQNIVRFSISLHSAFGGLHMANDHTFKQSDEDLKRKALVYLQATRTTVPEPMQQAMFNTANLEVAMRTTPHCFGLSSSWGAFRAGQASKTIAEPLQIRDTVVPPPIAKIGLIVSTMNKMLNLPIGHLLRTVYAPQLKAMTELRAKIIPNAAQYSGLYKHYGYTTQAVLTREEIDMAESLMPIVTAYALTFELDANGRRVGAALSKAVAKCELTESALVNLYLAAFQDYMDEGKDIRKLVSGEKDTGGKKK